jgi:hypothetical protein
MWVSPGALLDGISRSHRHGRMWPVSASARSLPAQMWASPGADVGESRCRCGQVPVQMRHGSPWRLSEHASGIAPWFALPLSLSICQRHARDHRLELVDQQGLCDAHPIGGRCDAKRHKGAKPVGAQGPRVTTQPTHRRVAQSERFHTATQQTHCRVVQRAACCERSDLHRDWAHPRHICIGTGLTPATSAARLGSPLPHLQRNWAHPAHLCTSGARLGSSLPC